MSSEHGSTRRARYELPDAGEQIVVDAGRVRDRLKAIAENEDVRKYIL